MKPGTNSIWLRGAVFGIYVSMIGHILFRNIFKFILFGKICQILINCFFLMSLFDFIGTVKLASLDNWKVLVW